MKTIDEDLVCAFLNDPGNAELADCLRQCGRITEAAAELIAGYGGDLYLDGLRRLSESVAASLSLHQGGRLSLDGLENLSIRAARHLVLHQGPVDLLGLRSLNDAPAATLAGHGRICVPYDLSPDARNGVLEASGFNKASKRPGVPGRKLQAVQIRIPETKRPLYQIQRFPQIVRHIREQVIPEYQNTWDNPTARSVMGRLEACLAAPVAPCMSFHFPLPEAARRLLEATSDWDETQIAFAEWVLSELDALDSEFIDVENLTESCHEGLGFSRRCFPRCHVEESCHNDDKISLGWRSVGNQIVITYSAFEARKKSVDTGQDGVPQQEISDLFNRALPPELTMVYFDEAGGNGLYVLMETANLGRLEALY